ncbi:MAG: mechanosensitive ion channel family protein, partial [Cyanobacteria bacterium J06626_14]
MDIQTIVQELFQIDAESQQALLTFGTKTVIFIVLLIGAWILSRLLPFILKVVVERLTPQTIEPAYEKVLKPIRRSLVRALFLGFVVLALGQFREYEGFYGVANFFLCLAFSLAAGWFLSRLVRQILQVYGVTLVKRAGYDADDFVIVVGNLANAMIVFFTVVYFAQTQNLNLISVLAGLGIVGLAISFAAKETF